VPFVAVIAACVALLWAFREPLARIGAGQGAVERGALHRIDVWRKKPVARPRIVLLGDSLNICSTPSEKKVQAVGPAIRSTANRAGRPVDVVDLTQPGLLPIHFYALLDDALATPVSLVALEINLRTFLNSDVRPGEGRLPGLARMLDFDDAIRARDALAREGMSVFDPPLMRLKDRLGLLYVLEGTRQGALDGIRTIGSWTTGALGLRRHAFGTRAFGEVNRRLALSYMVDYASHPNATVLRAAVDELRAAGIPFVVYVAPVNVEGLRGKGDFDPVELERLVEELRQSIGASRHEWLDLHAALPTGRFRDQQNHLVYEGCIDVGRPLAERALRLMAKHPAPAKPAPAGVL
jgi:hypothetical protein